jgi:hypothetical protein
MHSALTCSSLPLAGSASSSSDQFARIKAGGPLSGGAALTRHESAADAISAARDGIAWLTGVQSEQLDQIK